MLSESVEHDPVQKPASKPRGCRITSLMFNSAIKHNYLPLSTSLRKHPFHSMSLMLGTGHMTQAQYWISFETSDQCRINVVSLWKCYTILHSNVIYEGCCLNRAALFIRQVGHEGRSPMKGIGPAQSSTAQEIQHIILMLLGTL